MDNNVKFKEGYYEHTVDRKYQLNVQQKKKIQVKYLFFSVNNRG